MHVNQANFSYLVNVGEVGGMGASRLPLKLKRSRNDRVQPEQQLLQSQ